MLKSGEDKGIYPIARPRQILRCWQRRANRGYESPVLLPSCSLRDPFGQPLDLRPRKFVRRIRRRHSQRLIFCRDAPHQLALLWMTSNDGSPAFSQVGKGMSFGIEPERTLVVWGIRTVAGKTLIRKNRKNVSTEIDATSRITSRRRVLCRFR